MTQLKKALGYTRAASDPGDNRRGSLLTAFPQSRLNLSSLRCRQQSPSDLFRRYQLSSSAGYLPGDMRPFEENVPATASAALGRFREDRCSSYECHDRTLSPVWCTGSSYRRLSVNLDDDVSRLTASARSKTSLGHKSSLSKYTPLPAIGSGCSQDDPEVAANADESRDGDDEGQDVSETRENSDTDDNGHEESVDGENTREHAEPESEDSGSLEVEDGNLSGDEGEENEDEDDDKSQSDGEDGDDHQRQESVSNGENASENARPPLVRSRTFTVLKVDEPEGDNVSEGNSAVKKGGVAFFIGGADDGEDEKEKSEGKECEHNDDENDDDNQAD